MALPSIALDSRKAQLDLILDKVCVALQLTDTQYEDAGQKAEAVERWLSADDSPLLPFQPLIYPQGSMRIGTTNRPWSGEEFDQAGFDIAQAFAIGQLRKAETKELIQAGKAALSKIAVITRDAFLKLVGGKMLHHLREDRSAKMHAPWSRLQVARPPSPQTCVRCKGSFITWASADASRAPPWRTPTSPSTGAFTPTSPKC